MEVRSYGGASFDAMYINVNGESGFFETSLAAYGQEGEPCARCGRQIRRIAFGNQPPHICPKCQVKGLGGDSSFKMGSTLGIDF